MKQTKEVHYPARKVQECVGFTCDRCKKEFRNAAESGLSGGVTWGPLQSGDFTQTTVSLTKGSSWPEGTCAVERDWHVCPECFEQWLRPILSAECGPGERTEQDY